MANIIQEKNNEASITNRMKILFEQYAQMPVWSFVNWSKIGRTNKRKIKKRRQMQVNIIYICVHMYIFGHVISKTSHIVRLIFNEGTTMTKRLRRRKQIISSKLISLLSSSRAVSALRVNLRPNAITFKASIASYLSHRAFISPVCV